VIVYVEEDQAQDDLKLEIAQEIEPR